MEHTCVTFLDKIMFRLNLNGSILVVYLRQHIYYLAKKSSLCDLLDTPLKSHLFRNMLKGGTQVRSLMCGDERTNRDINSSYRDYH